MTLNFIRPLAFALSVSSAIVLTGCNVTTDKDGQHKNVDIATPFGSMSVKSNNSVDSGSIGLSVYPGSVPLKEHGDNNSADVNMNFGNFHLGVKAASYQTSDSQEKVISFYRKDMARYGAVITCKGHQVIGVPERTADGLNCEENNHNHISTSGNEDLELRAGSPSHQHIVGVETKDGGTRIGLVSLILPVGSKNHSDKESE